MTRVADISHRKKFLADGNVYLPHIAVIEKIIEETPAVRTYHFNFKDEKLREEFTFESGQFGEYSVLGEGLSRNGVYARFIDVRGHGLSIHSIHQPFSHAHSCSPGVQDVHRTVGQGPR